MKYKTQKPSKGMKEAKEVKMHQNLQKTKINLQSLHNEYSRWWLIAKYLTMIGKFSCQKAG